MSIKPGKIVISGPMCKPRFKPSDFPSQALSTMSPISLTYSLGFTSAAVSLKFGRSNQTIENDWSNDLFQVISNLANQLSSRGPLLPRARLMPQAYLWDWGGLCWGGTHISRKLTIEEAPSFYLLKSSVIIMIACDNWWHWATEKSEFTIHSFEIEQTRSSSAWGSHLSRCQRPRPQCWIPSLCDSKV